MSTENATPAPDTSAPVANGADTSAPVVDAPSAEGDEFLSDTPESEAKPAEGEAEDGKTETKPEGEEKDFLAETDEDEAKSEADAPGDAKPEAEAQAYQPFTLPDGQQIDEAALAKATPVFRKLNIDQAGAQELVSLQADIMQGAVQAYHQTLAEGHANTLKTWAQETKAHPEFGGQNLKASKAAAAQALALEPGARKVLVDYGLDRNPAVFALLARLGTKLSPDSLVRDDAGTPVKAPPTRDADVFYEN